MTTAGCRKRIMKRITIFLFQMKNITFLMLTLIIASCTSNSSKDKNPENNPDTIAYYNITGGDTLRIYDEDYPIGLRVIKDRLYVLFTRRDSALEVINLNDRNSYNIGRVGVGPKDVLSPSFYYNGNSFNDSTLRLWDPNSAKLLTLNYGDSIFQQDKMPRIIAGESSINMEEGSFVSYPIDDSSVFMIITTGEKQIHVQRPFEVSEESEASLKGRKMFFAPNINANKNKNRIIASMFFVDEYYVFDFKGNLLSKKSVSAREVNYNEAISNYINIDDAGYFRYGPGYSDENGCFLWRIKEIPDKENMRYTHENTEIVETDWDGNIRAIYPLPPNTISYCVAEARNLYVLTNSVDSQNEYYYVLCFKLQDKI